MIKARILALALTGWTVLLTSGCGGPESNTVPVEGSVYLDGEPLDRATVTFYPADDTGKVVSGRTNGDGVFTVDAVPGNYKVTVVKQSSAQESQAEDIAELSGGERGAAMAKGTQAAAREKEKEAKKSTKKTKSKKKKEQLVPDAYMHQNTTKLHYKIPSDERIEINIKRASGK